MDEPLTSTTRSQHGLVTLAQATSGGLSLRSVQRRVESGWWEPVHPGVYRVAGTPLSWEQDLLAACLAAGGLVAASHRSAAVLWELGDVSDPVPEISVARTRFPRPEGALVHRSTDLTPPVTTRRRGIPVTSPARTLVDLGAVVDRRAVERALDRALTRRVVTLKALRVTLDEVARRGRRGAGVLRALLDERSDAAGLTESVLEARFLRLCRDRGLPEPTCQYRVRVGRRLVGRVDFAFPGGKVAIEVDGYEAHASLAAFQRDRARQNELVEAGWTVLRFTWDDVTRRPEQVAASTARFLSRLPTENVG